ncbi:hypothetical protein BpHYR1_032602 [Brachionus plicatilis]|uniref:Uncharacterized protein n=1 Tax=Brachionus plicatilis TaxID=10195 RepID=A0A3M7QZN2_BRAPC|nr:hypothetical protein BpHYR1_032602 [Brachionus plicatilis]
MKYNFTKLHLKNSIINSSFFCIIHQIAYVIVLFLTPPDPLSGVVEHIVSFDSLIKAWLGLCHNQWQKKLNSAFFTFYGRYAYDQGGIPVTTNFQVRIIVGLFICMRKRFYNRLESYLFSIWLKFFGVIFAARTIAECSGTVAKLELNLNLEKKRTFQVIMPHIQQKKLRINIKSD